MIEAPGVEQLAALINFSVDAVVLVDIGGIVRWANPATTSVLGYAPDDLIGLRVRDIVEPQDHAAWQALVRQLFDHPDSPQTGAFRCRHRDGTVRWTEGVARNLLAEPKVGAIVVHYRDVSGRVKIEHQLRQAQKMEAVGRLAGGIAHDFNDLLTAIRGNAELISHRVKKDSAMAADVDEILHAADRAASLTRQLLAFSRKQILQPVALDINEIVSSVTRVARWLIGTGVQLQQELSPAVAQVIADPAQIEQVLLHLIVNARDAMPTGGMITVQTAHIRLEAGSPEMSQAGLSPGPFVLLAVSDSGMGMDQATHARMFEPVFTTKEIGRGAGLGLSAVYAIVRQTGGAISVVSERGRGASFRVYLPAVTGELS